MTIDNHYGFLLTWPTHLDKSLLHKHLLISLGLPMTLEKRPDEERKQAIIIIAHESGHKQTPYDHTHAILIKLRNANPTRFKTTNSTLFDFQKQHFNLKNIKSGLLNQAKACCYVTKEDISLQDLHKKYKLLRDSPTTKTLQLINDSNTFAEAVAVGGGISRAFGIKLVFDDRLSLRTDNYDTVKKYLQSFEYSGWQIDINNLIKSYPDGNPRNCLWLFGQHGHEGKSTWGAKRATEDPENFFFIDGLFDQNNLVQILREQAPPEWNGRGLILDVTRHHLKTDLLYHMIETIQSHIIRGSKYKGGCITIVLNWFILLSNEIFASNSEISEDRLFAAQIIDHDTQQPFIHHDDHLDNILNPYTQRKDIEEEMKDKLQNSCLYYYTTRTGLAQEQEASQQRLLNMGVHKRYLAAPAAPAQPEQKQARVT